ncbi:guanine nucleotide-binding protein G(q) subunit alpha-like isoform X2 [Homarus americanus]|uniref:guanine nucleotide-binding protein G(q) subunit alpha-like isoform X2 n=1 Tax=Homarus americanus TaxID=6706 RepID=UPI001C448488|nr:guanine nucleotide-binding protein G(q) subunit alpha-like isoform X2 [Homarus americanus]
MTIPVVRHLANSIKQSWKKWRGIFQRKSQGRSSNFCEEMETDNEDDMPHNRRGRSLLHRIWRAIVSILQRLQIFDFWRNREDFYQRTFTKPAVPEARLLVLGASDTGKSTFMKQMRLVFGDEYPVPDRRRHQPHIRRNLLESVHRIIQAMDTFGITQATQEAQDAARRFTDLEPLEQFLEDDAIIDHQLVEQTQLLWADPMVQEVYIRGNEYHLMTNADYFITNAERILDDNYIPNVDDILRMRYPTRTSVTSTYDLGEMRMTMHDMGGQRSEREQWIKHDNNPTAILFLASLSEYDQNVEEIPEKNRVQESLDIFEDLLGYPPFETTPVILLLNKSDIFRSKIQYHALRDYFPEYDGPDGDEIEGRDFISRLYEKLAVRHRRHFVARFTEATNTENFRAIFTFIRSTVSRNMMGRGGLC